MLLKRKPVRSRVKEASWELALLVILYVVYSAGRLVARERSGDAYGNADQILGLESTWPLPAESTIQSLVLDVSMLPQALNLYYALVHFPLTVAVLLWLWAKHRPLYGGVRSVLALLTGLGLVVHIAYPLAPPRLLPGRGFVDTGAVHGPSVYQDVGHEGLANQFAAMPSLHCGWALLMALAVIRATRTRWRWLWLAHPAITLLVVVGTANHYWIDAVVAFVLLALSILLVRAAERRRRRAPKISRGDRLFSFG